MSYLESMPGEMIDTRRSTESSSSEDLFGEHVTFANRLAR